LEYGSGFLEYEIVLLEYASVFYVFLQHLWHRRFDTKP
jgi:hypothetical protein